MNIFEITIQPKTENSWPVAVKYTPSGQPPRYCKGMLNLNSNDDFFALRQNEILTENYGKELGEALFSGDIKDFFKTALSNSQQNIHQPKLHVFLHSDTADDDSIKNLRWERLCAPFSPKSNDDWRHLSIDRMTPFSIFIPTMTERLFPVIGRNELQALIVVANPFDPQGKYGLADFDVQKTIDSVKKSLGSIPCSVLAKDVNGALGLPTLEHIKKHLSSQEKYYTLLHVVCHGKLVNGETVIYLAKDDNTIDPVKASDLIKELKDLPHAPHFAFLSTCESASPESEQMGGLAQSLAQKLGMPAVLGMTAPVTIDTAEHLAEAFYQELREHGDVSLALSEAIAELRRNRDDITVPVLFSRLGGKPLFSKELDGRNLTNSEIKMGLERIKELLPERAPVLTEEFNALQKKLGNLNIDFVALSDTDKTEREAALKDLNNLCNQVFDVSFNALALTGELTNYDSRCPFKGLKPFRKEDRDFFCGRELLISDLKAKLEKHNFLAVLGPSGSGKSSVVLAGLIPALEEQHKDKGIEVVELTPNNNPIERLQNKLSEVKQQPFILVVDQFEEVFTLCGKEIQKQFITELLNIAESSKVIVTMRADFWGECAYYEHLKEVMQRNQELVSPMNAAELREAIEEQAEKVGLRFESGVVNLIIKDVEGEPGEMPLLQYALEELWQRRRGKWLLGEEYEEIGFKEAIARTADSFYNKLSSEVEQEEVKNIFLRLTRLGESWVEEEKHKHTRQRVYLKDLMSASDNPKIIEELVRRLAGEEARLVVTRTESTGNGANQNSERTVEVAHEALITHWPKLQGWLEEDRVNLQLRQSIRDAESKWKKSQKENNQGNEESFLVHHGSQLEAAEELLKRRGFFNDKEIEYVNACIERRNRLKREQLEQVIATYSAYSQTLFVSNRRLDALVELIKAGELLKKEKIQLSAAAEFRFLATFAQIFAEVDEFNCLKGHKDYVSSVAFSPDDRVIASASYDKTIKLWNRDGSLIQTLSGHANNVMDVCFSPDGNFLASASLDNTIKLWQKQEISQPPQWRLVQTLEHTSRVLAIKFSPKGDVIASGSMDNTVILWHCQDGVYLPKILAGHTDQVVDVAFSPDGKIIASASKDKTIKLWTLEGELLRTIEGHEETVTSVSFSSDNQTLISSSEDKTIRLWGIDGSNFYPEFSESPVNSVAFSQDGQTIASANEDGTIVIWQKDDNNYLTKLRTLKGHKDKVLTVNFSSDRNTIVSCSCDKTIKLWQGYGKFEGYSANITSIDFSADGQIIAIASEDRTVKLWSSNGKLQQTLPLDNSEVFDVKFNPSGGTIATASKDGNIKLWSLEGKLIDSKIFPSSNGHELRNISFSPDGTLIAIASNDATVRLWRPGDNSVKVLQKHESGVNRVTFSPCGTKIASASKDTTVIVWNLDGTIYRILKGHKDGVYDVRFSPDSETIATFSTDELKIWHLQGSSLQPLDINQQYGIICVNFIGSNTLASAMNNQTLELWSLEGKLLQKQNVHEENEDYINVGTFSHDGNIIALANLQGKIKLWLLNLDKLLNNSQNLIQDYLRLQK